jgi:hypothetical protein
MRAGWIVLGWTGRVWIPFHDTAARTRTEALQKWREPLGVEHGWPEWERQRLAGVVKAVRTYTEEECSLHIDGTPV